MTTSSSIGPAFFDVAALSSETCVGSEFARVNHYLRSMPWMELYESETVGREGGFGNPDGGPLCSAAARCRAPSQTTSGKEETSLCLCPRLSGASAFSLLIRNTNSSLMIKACPRSHLLRRKRHFSGSRCNLAERGHDRATDTLFVFFPTPLSVSHAFLSFDCLDLTLLERRLKPRVSEEPKIEGGGLGTFSENFPKCKCDYANAV